MTAIFMASINIHRGHKSRRLICHRTYLGFPIRFLSPPPPSPVSQPLPLALKGNPVSGCGVMPVSLPLSSLFLSLSQDSWQCPESQNGSFRFRWRSRSRRQTTAAKPACRDRYRCPGVLDEMLKLFLFSLLCSRVWLLIRAVGKY